MTKSSPGRIIPTEFFFFLLFSISFAYRPPERDNIPERGERVVPVCVSI